MRNKKVFIGATVGLALGAVALAPVLPMPLGLNSAYAIEGTNVEVSNYADFREAILNSTATTVTLANNMSDLTSILEIPAGRTVTINLNGHILGIRNTGDRGIINRGNLTITGGGKIRNSSRKNDSRGLIDNYGTLTVEEANLFDYGADMGSTIRNFGTTYLKSSAKVAGYNDENGNAGVYAASGDVFIEDGAVLSSVSEAYYPIQIGEGNVTIGTLNSENPAKIQSKAASIYVFGAGKLTINNAEIASENNQAIRVDANTANVEINGGKFTAPYGGVYIYTTERGTNPLVTINGGDFSGRWASIVSTNRAGDLESWAFDLKGGVYAGTRVRNYLSEGYKAYEIPEYFENGWSGYSVEACEGDNIPSTIYMKKGTQVSFGISATSLRHANISMDRDDVIILDGNEITSGKTGIVNIVTDLRDGSDPIETTVYSYTILFSAALVDNIEGEGGAALLAALNGAKKVGFVDIEYARIIDGEEFDNPEELEEPVTILVDMPELPAVPEGYKRSFKMLNFKDGAVTEVPGFAISGGKLGFETKIMTPYILAYVDTEIPVEPEPEKPADDGGKEKDPKQPLIPKDNTFDFDDPADIDPLGEIFTQPAKTAAKPTPVASGKAVGVPNTAKVANSSEINLMIAMMVGSATLTGAVLGIKKYAKR